MINHFFSEAKLIILQFIFFRFITTIEKNTKNTKNSWNQLVGRFHLRRRCLWRLLAPIWSGVQFDFCPTVIGLTLTSPSRGAIKLVIHLRKGQSQSVAKYNPETGLTFDPWPFFQMAKVCQVTFHTSLGSVSGHRGKGKSCFLVYSNLSFPLKWGLCAAALERTQISCPELYFKERLGGPLNQPCCREAAACPQARIGGLDLRCSRARVCVCVCLVAGVAAMGSWL